jgi:hypothetical protein
MIWFILGIIIGTYAEWKWQFANNIIESIKTKFNIK